MRIAGQAQEAGETQRALGKRYNVSKPKTKSLSHVELTTDSEKQMQCNTRSSRQPRFLN